MWCELSEAFDNGHILNKEYVSTDKYSKITNMYPNEEYNNDTNSFFQTSPHFSVQGNLNNLVGSNDDAKNDEKKEIQNQNQNKNIDHRYYINKFVESLFKNNDASKTNVQVFDHVKNCNLCRENIKHILDSKKSTNKNNKHMQPPVINYNDDGGSDGDGGNNNYPHDLYNSNGIEMMILIMIGIIIILIIDMIFKLEY